MPYENTRQLKEDILFRASEPPGGVSAWETKVIDYLNRVYRTLAAGANEFLPEFIDDWWWMREESYFILEPVYTDGTVSAVNGSNVVTFSNPPPFDPSGYMIRFKDIQVPDVFRLEIGLGASQPNQELDAPFTGVTTTGASFQLMRTHYSPPADVRPQVLIGPMRAFRDQDQILGLSQERMDELWPLNRLAPGTPRAFAIVQELNEVQNPGEKFEVRFSHGGLVGQQQRIDFWFRPVLVDLTDTTASIPRVPAQWRHVLADMALVQVLLDKNDDRANAAALGARTGLAAMLKENRRRSVKIDYNAGHIYPRGGIGQRGQRRVLRTESGLIIG